MLLSDEIVARGKRTIIRRKRVSDAADEYGWRSDKELARYDAAPIVTTNFADYLRRWTFDLHFTDVGQRSFALENESGHHIGNVMYYNVNTQRSEAELGISIGDKSYWGLGYGSDATIATTRFVFRKTDLKWLYLHTLNWNLRAQNCFLKAGFRKCGTAWRRGYSFTVMRVTKGQSSGSLE